MTTTTGYSALQVQLVQLTAHPFAQAWRQYRETWLHLHNKEYDSTDKECQTAIDRILSRQALPIPLEDWQLELRITGLSRVALAQITRGRLGQNYVVQSQMPQRIRHEAVVPLNVATDSRFAERAAKLQSDAEALYDDMYNAGIPPQDCRYLTLHGQTTSLVWHVNYAALQSFFAMRAENGLTDELNMVCRLTRAAIRNYALKYSDTHSDWLRLAELLDCMGSRQKLCLNVDEVFGNTGRYASSSPAVPSPDGLLKPAYDFTKSAWYLELVQLYNSGRHELLFDGEEAMVQRWLSGGNLTP